MEHVCSLVKANRICTQCSIKTNAANVIRNVSDRVRAQKLLIVLSVNTFEMANTVWPNARNQNMLKTEHVTIAMKHASVAPDQETQLARMDA